jgi:virulence-associated protein VapD
VHAIIFDMDAQRLCELFPTISYNDACADITKTLAARNFRRQQGSLFFGSDQVDAVACVLAVQELTCTYPWFGPSVRDIRMFRFEDINDLMPAVERAINMSLGNRP